METNIRRTFRHAIVLDEAELRAVTKLLQTEYAEVRFVVECVEGSRISFETLDELLDFENPYFRRIVGLEISFGESQNACGTLVVHSGDFLKTVEFVIRGKVDSKAIKTATELSSRIATCRPWYSPFSIASLSAVLPFVLFSWVYLLISYYLIQGHPLPDMTSEQAAMLFVFSFPFMFGLKFGAPFADVYWLYLFPRVSILIGKQREEYDTQSSLRNWVLGTAVATIALGLLVNWLSSKLWG